jgi:HEAT repeat protein
MPAAIADSADVWQPLIAIARDAARPRETRTTALTWVGRAAGEMNAAPSEQVAGALVSLAGDQDAPRPVREQAMSTLSRLPRGEGVPALVQMVNNQGDTWLGRRAMSALANSGDPRAREFLRQVAGRDSGDEEIRYTAIRGIGGSYTTGQDMAFLRQLFPRITNPTAKDAVISAAADQGGRENVQFLLNVTANPTESATIRRRALQSAGRAEAPIGDLTALYARVDQALREDLINIYSRRTEAAAIDRLIEIAKTDEDASLRRKAISALSRSDDPRVVAALRQIIVP